MISMKPNQFLRHMVDSVAKDDQRSIAEINSKLANKEYVFRSLVESKASIPNPDDEYVELKRHIRVLLNEVEVYRYEDIHYGYRGGNGTGWFVEESESNLDQDIMETLCYFGIEWPALNVPKPEQIRG